MRKQVELILFLVLLSLSLGGQEIIYESYPGRTDLWVLIPYNDLVFRQGAGSGQFQVTLEISNNKTKQVSNFDSKLDVPRREWLQDTGLPVSFSSTLEPGKYQVRLRVKNMDLGSKTDLKREFVIGEELTEIGQPYFLAGKEGVVFQPSEMSRLPLPLDSCEIRQRFSILADSVHVALGGDTLSWIHPAGGYTADLARLINLGVAAAPRISIYEGNIRYDMDPFLYNRWFYYNARYSYKDQIEQLRYIANQNEWKSLRKIPEEMYADAIDKYWRMHDPSPGTLRNEFRENFYQRVITADERFTIHKKLKGWKSDRGRIYIKYGEPDETYSEVHPIDMYPYIVWIYYSENLQFEFADTGGFGQYRLRNKDEEY
jgi:GWxTD domain-containing protein